MNRTLTTLLSVLFALIAAPALAVSQGADQPQAKIGEKAPEFTLTDSRGNEHSLSDYAGRIVVLEWTNRECPVVQELYDDKVMKQTYDAVRKLDKDVVWLAINSTHTTSAQQNNAWIKQHRIAYPILLDADGTVGRNFKARTTPHMYVLDADRTLVYSGALDSDDPWGNKREAGEPVTNYVINAVRQLKAEETVSPDSTKPYGCKVKYAPR